MTTVRVMSTLATQVAWPQLVALFKARTGHDTADVFGPTNGLLQRIAGGETADVAILVAQSARDLASKAVLDLGTDFATSVVGMAVKAGAPRPDISSVAALKATLLDARSIAYSRLGASGVYFADLLQRLGLADVVNAKATIIPTGLTGERVVRGETELAVQQISELKAVSGIDILGPIPLALQTPTVLTAATFTASPHKAASAALVELLTSPEARAILSQSGLDPIA